MRDIFLELLIPRVLDLVRDGKAFFGELKRLLPEHFPDRLGSWEPLQRVDATVLERTLKHLQQQGQKSLDWKRMGSSSGRVFVGRSGVKPLHASLKLQLQRKKSDAAALLLFFKRLSEEFVPDFAALQLISDADVERARQNGTGNFLDVRQKKFNFLVTTHHLSTYLPDLYWGTVLGKPYIEMFGRENILAAPAYRVEELPSKAICIQLTASLEDSEKNSELVEATRQAIKAHLNERAKCSAFFDPELGANFLYQTPGLFEGQYLPKSSERTFVH